jgi:endonuclease-8
MEEKMEGPSLFLAAEQLKDFIGQEIIKVEGNSRIGKERLLREKIVDIFSWGKHLIFQFSNFALRVHFMLFGSFEAYYKGISVKGDYPRKQRSARLALYFAEGEIILFSCFVKFLEGGDVRLQYDFTSDIMSSEWKKAEAIEKISQLEGEIADALLDQTIFSGVGNIIKNEVLFLEQLSPEEKIKNISRSKIASLVKTTKEFSLQFYKWRKNFEIKNHYQIYKKKKCPRCHEEIVRKKTGRNKRWSYFCAVCQRAKS